MSVTLTEHDKELIRLIDLQVEQLRYKKTQDYVIVNTLMDFIPESQCMVYGTCEKQLDLYRSEYPNFNYFLKLINQMALM